MYFHNSAHSFSSFNLVISGVWEPCRTTSINVWHSGLHHRPHSIEMSLYSACMTTIQSVARHECTFWLVSATLKKLSTAPASVSLLPVAVFCQNLPGHDFTVSLLASLRSGSMCRDWIRAARAGLHWTLKAVTW